jgi:hypothetical protein
VLLPNESISSHEGHRYVLASPHAPSAGVTRTARLYHAIVTSADKRVIDAAQAAAHLCAGRLQQRRRILPLPTREQQVRDAQLRRRARLQREPPRVCEQARARRGGRADAMLARGREEAQRVVEAARGVQLLRKVVRRGGVAWVRGRDRLRGLKVLLVAQQLDLQARVNVTPAHCKSSLVTS